MTLAIVLIPVIFITALVLFNMTQVSTEKQKLQNTVDAMVYSVSLMEARDLNFAAYMNRAMVSNQVAVAQSVSLLSWARYVYSEAQFIAAVMDIIAISFEWVPGLDVVLDVMAEAADDFAEAAYDFVQDVVAPLTSAVASALDVWLDALSVTEVVFHVATLDSGLEALFVVQAANDPTARLSMLGGAGGVAHAVEFYACFTTLARPYSGKNAKDAKPYLQRFAETGMKARDGFSADRSHNYEIPFLTKEIIPGWLKMETKLGRWGGTDFNDTFMEPGDSEDKAKNESWYAAGGDFAGGGVMFSVNWPTGKGKWVCIKQCKSPAGKFCCPFSWRWKGEFKWTNYPGPSGSVFYGMAYEGVVEPFTLGMALNPQPWSGKSPSPFAFQYGGAIPYQDEGIIAAVGEFIEEDESEKTYSGMKPYVSIRKTSVRSDDSASIIIQIQKPASGVRTSGNIQGMGSGKYDLSAQAQQNMYAVAKAGAHFSRDYWPRMDGKEEFGNMFNPYWEARLASLTDDEQKAVATWDDYRDNPGDIFKDLGKCLLSHVESLDVHFMDCFNSGGQPFPGADIVNAIKSECSGG